MNRTGRKRRAKATAPKRDVVDVRVFREHRNDDFAILAEIFDGTRNVRALFGELHGCLRRHVVNGKIVSATQDAVGHSPAHPAETDKSHSHAASFYSNPLARACSRPTTAQSFVPSPWAIADSKRSRKALPLGSGTRAASAAAI